MGGLRPSILAKHGFDIRWRQESGGRMVFLNRRFVLVHRNTGHGMVL